MNTGLIVAIVCTLECSTTCVCLVVLCYHLWYRWFSGFLEFSAAVLPLQYCRSVFGVLGWGKHFEILVDRRLGFRNFLLQFFCYSFAILFQPFLGLSAFIGFFRFGVRFVRGWLLLMSFFFYLDPLYLYCLTPSTLLIIFLLVYSKKKK